MIKKGSTLFLKIVLCFIALAVLAICIFGLPAFTRGLVTEWPQVYPLREPILAGLYVITIPFFMCLYQAFRLLNYIDKNSAFSIESIMALRYIKYSASIMSGLCMLGMPVVFMVAELDDAPGLVIVGFLAACSPIVIAVFAAVLQKLLQNAIDLKSETELTV